MSGDSPLQGRQLRPTGASVTLPGASADSWKTAGFPGVCLGCSTHGLHSLPTRLPTLTPPGLIPSTLFLKKREKHFLAEACRVFKGAFDNSAVLKGRRCFRRVAAVLSWRGCGGTDLGLLSRCAACQQFVLGQVG